VPKIVSLFAHGSDLDPAKTAWSCGTGVSFFSWRYTSTSGSKPLRTVQHEKSTARTKKNLPASRQVFIARTGIRR